MGGNDAVPRQRPTVVRVNHGVELVLVYRRISRGSAPTHLSRVATASHHHASAMHDAARSWSVSLLNRTKTHTL